MPRLELWQSDASDALPSRPPDIDDWIQRVKSEKYREGKQGQAGD